MIVGLPKAPSRYNPIVNSDRATIRRNYVLGRMRSLDFITEEGYQAALATKDNASIHGQDIEIEAPYVAEMVRSEMLARYGHAAYTRGYKVYTTIDGPLQKVANKALRSALHAYDRRHGYRGIISHVDVSNFEFDDDESYWDSILAGQPALGDLVPSLVFQVEDQSAYAYTAEGNVVFLGWPQLKWARRYIDEFYMGPKLSSARQILKPGDVIYTVPARRGCSWLAEIPQVSGALISMVPENGAIRSLVGGFDYYQSKFNRVIQAKRQPGSSFKPFIYSAALDKGFTAASIINDAPVVFDAPGLEDTWRPENYTGKWYGDTRLREALMKSRNLVSIRLLRDIGIGYTVRYVTRFGFKRKSLPRNLSLALGSGAITPMELSTGFSVFANGGFKIQSYFIKYILDSNGKVVMVEQPLQVCVPCVEEMEARQAADKAAKEAEQKTHQLASENSPPTLVASSPVQTPSVKADTDISDTLQPDVKKANEEEGITGQPEIAETLPQPAEQTVEMLEQQGPQLPNAAPRVLSPQTTFLINSMMRDVIRHGTGRRALKLGRKDLAGKTGTTNDQRDAWFSGFNHNLVAVAWVGFDNPRSLGSRETGAIAALPMWNIYMAEALRGMPEVPLKQPQGVVSVRIDKRTGLPASAESTETMFEYFLTDQVPSEATTTQSNIGSTDNGADITEQLF